MEQELHQAVIHHRPQQTAWGVGATASRPTRSIIAFPGVVGTLTSRRGYTTVLDAAIGLRRHRTGTLMCRASAESLRLASGARPLRQRPGVAPSEARGRRQPRSQRPTCVRELLPQTRQRKWNRFLRPVRPLHPGALQPGRSHSERQDLPQGPALPCATLQSSRRPPKEQRMRTTLVQAKPKELLEAVIHHRPQLLVLVAEVSRQGHRPKQEPPSGRHTTSEGRCVYSTPRMMELSGGLSDVSTYASGTPRRPSSWRYSDWLGRPTLPRSWSRRSSTRAASVACGRNQHRSRRQRLGWPVTSIRSCSGTSCSTARS